MSELEFNHDGSVKVPKNYKKKKRDLNKTIILEYERENWGDSIDCEFIITFPKIANEELLKGLEDWVDKKVEIDSILTKIEIEKITPNKFKLLISGKGNDNRCTWCRSFRTSLKTLSNKEQMGFLQKNFCKFD